MKKLASTCFAVFVVASASFAQMTPGVVAASSDRFPIVADFDGDGLADLFNDRTVSINNGVSFGKARDLGIPGPYEAVKTVADVDGDGKDEILPLFRIPGPQIDHYRVATGDIDNDGITDMVIRCNPDLVVLHGEGGGRFTVQRRWLPMAHETWGWWNTRLADVDGDGNLDIVTVGYRTLHVLFGDGHGTFPRYATAKVAAFPSSISCRATSTTRG